MGGRVVDLAGQRDDPAERGDGIAGQRGGPRVGECRAFRRAARVGVLDDHAGGSVEAAGDGRRRRCVEDVVVRELLALERARAGRERALVGARAGSAVPGGRLVGVLPVPQRLDLLEPDREAGREWVVGAREAGLVGQLDARRGHPARELGRDAAVVGRGVPERLDREGRPEAVGDAAAAPHGLEDGG